MTEEEREMMAEVYAIEAYHRFLDTADPEEKVPWSGASDDVRAYFKYMADRTIGFMSYMGYIQEPKSGR